MLWFYLVHLLLLFSLNWHTHNSDARKQAAAIKVLSIHCWVHFVFFWGKTAEKCAK